MSLNAKQQRFALAYARTFDALEAFRAAYSMRSISRAKALDRAEKLLQRPEIRALIENVRNGHYIDPLSNINEDPPPHDEKPQIFTNPDKQHLTMMLIQAYQKAAEDKRGASAMISACLAIAKLNGHLNETDQKAADSPHFQTLIENIRKARLRLHEDAAAANATKARTSSHKDSHEKSATQADS